MSTTSTTPRPLATPVTRGSAWRRFGSLVRGETTILLRNRTAVFTAVALPFLMGFAFAGFSLDRAALGVVLTIVLVCSALMFVIYYTMVTSLVARREQLVLKRLVSGEPTPLEVLVAPVVPLWVLFVFQSLVGIGGALALGTPVAHPWALALAAVGGATAWTGLAILSACWTRTVESAQLTTMPLILVSMLLSGFSLPLAALPALVQRIAHWLPMTPVVDLITLGYTGAGIDGTVLTEPRDLLAAVIGMLLPLGFWTALSVHQGLRTFRWDPRS